MGSGYGIRRQLVQQRRRTSYIVSSRRRLRLNDHSMEVFGDMRGLQAGKGHQTVPRFLFTGFVVGYRRIVTRTSSEVSHPCS